jgi:hypothetical protein
MLNLEESNKCTIRTIFNGYQTVTLANFGRRIVGFFSQTKLEERKRELKQVMA